MKKIFSFLKNNLAIIALFFTWLPITFYNTKIYWMLVDDGWDVIYSRTLFEKLSTLNMSGFLSQLLEGDGRFRPVYWIYHMIVWLIGKNSYQFHHLVHMLVIGITVLFIFLIIKELTKSKIASFFGGLFYLLIPLNTENILRLGPQEPLLAMFFSILFYLLVKNKKIFLTCLILVLAIFTKETSIAIIPVLFIYYIFSKKNKLIENKKQGFYVWMTICVSAVTLVLITFLRREGYSTNYFFDIPMLGKNVVTFYKEFIKNSFLIIPFVPLFYLVRKGVTLIKKQRFFESKLDLFEFLFFVGFLCLFSIQLPWKYALTRYLMPSIFFLTIFSFVEIYQDIKLIAKLKFVNRHKRIFAFLLTVIGIYVFSIWGLDVILKEKSSISTYKAFSIMASYPKDTVILMNMLKGEGTVELVDEIRIHLSEFWGRSDIQSKYLELDNLPKSNYVIVDSDQFPRGYPKENLDKLFRNKSTSLDLSTKKLVLTTPTELIKQIIKKVAGLVIHKKQITSEGIYTYYYNNSNWHFFHE